MKTVLLDTNGYTTFVRGNIEILAHLSSAITTYISPIVLGELLSGFKGGAREKDNTKTLHQFLQEPTVETLMVSPETAEIYGTIKHELKKRGRPIPTNDIWVAAQTIETGSVLITFDNHFAHIPGLRLWGEFPQK